MSTRRPLSSTGDVPRKLLRLTAQTTGVFPPLKRMASDALEVVELVANFRTNKKIWADLGAYVQDAAAHIVVCLAQVDGSHGDFKARLENLQAALDRAITRIRSEQAQSRSTRAFRFLREPDMVVDLRRELDDVIGLFELSAISMAEMNVQKTLDAVATNNIDEVISISRKASLIALNATLQRLQYVPGASWDMHRVCLPGTRTEIIDDTLAWLNSVDQADGAKILLLTAVAGAGKSTIAHTIAQHCQKHGLLATSFFFDRETEGRNKPTSLFTTMAADLSRVDRRFGACITAAIESDQSLPHAPLSRQFEELILKPSQECAIRGSLVIVIDALDEGWDENMLRIFQDRVPYLPGAFRIFLTSRMRPDLHSLTQKKHVRWVDLEIDTAENMGDIAVFIPHKPRQVVEARSLEKDWPGEDLRRQFAARAEGLFLWVATVCNQLKHQADPTRQLRMLLSSSGGSATTAEKKMDNLYGTILGSFDWDDEDFRLGYHRLMGAAIATKTPLTIDALNTLFHDPPVASSYVLQQLSPLLAGMREEANHRQPVRVLHQSLRDFLVDRAGNSPNYKHLQIVEKKHSQELALMCLNVLNHDLNENTAGVGYLSKTEEEVPGVPSMRDTEISEALWYACRFWIDHLLDVDTPDQAEISEMVRSFIGTKVTLWMEVMAARGRFRGLVENWPCSKVLWELDVCKNTHATEFESLSSRLRYEDRREEALAAMQEAVELYRQTAADAPTESIAELANSLVILSVRLSDMGRREEALETSEEVLKIYRQLVADQPAEFNPKLANSLNNLSVDLAQLNRREDALKVIGEAVELYRRLAADRPVVFTPDLATSLNNLSGSLSELGRREEALEAIEEAVELRRQLATDRPSAFTPDLAQSLNNLSLRLSDLGRCEEALKVIEESVELRRQLAADRPAAFAPYLAGSLNNLSLRLSDLGRREEGFKAIEEAVELYQQLAADRPAAFAPALAMSLYNLSISLSGLDRHDEALAASQEALQIRRQLADERPAVFMPKLIDGLERVAECLDNLGRRQEALTMEKEARLLKD